MNWEAIGAIGEIVGAAGVIVTLLYLASQLRQNTRALQVTSIDSTTQVGNTVRWHLASHPEDREWLLSVLRAPRDQTPAEEVTRVIERFRSGGALAAVGTRHRNLLAMSPASVLPARARFDRASFELLPLLEHADAWCIPPASLQAELNLNEFRELHRRSWAVLQRRNGRRLVAEQV